MTDAEIVLAVQKRLLELGYSGLGEADGDIGRKTEASILNFRNRNGLPLVPGIDDQLIQALATASRIALPIEQTTATAAHVATKVDAVKQTRLGKLVARIAMWPSLVVAFFVGIIDNLGDAINSLVPLKTFLSDRLSDVNPLTVVAFSAGAVGLVSALLLWKSHQAEASMVQGFQLNTVRPDNKEVTP